MAIIRTAPTRGFTVVQNEMLEDPRIGMKAKGLLTYLLGKPEDWVVHVSQLAAIGPDGKKSMYAGIKELVDAGYIEKIQHRGENGLFGELEYIVHPTPQIRTDIEPQPCTPFRHTVDRHADNRTLQKNDSYKEITNQPQTPKPEPKTEPEPEQKPEPETPRIVPTSDSTLGYNATDDDRRINELPFENKKQPIAQNQRMQIEEWMALWRKYLRKHWPAGQNQRAIHVLRYWTRDEIEAAFATLPKADYPGWRYLKAIFENQAGDQVATGKDRELELFLGERSTPRTKIDDISKYL